MEPKNLMKDLSLADLKTLLNALPVEIKLREEAEKVQVIKDLEAFAAGRGFKLAELLANVERVKTESKVRTPAPAKYRNPQDPTVTWSGRGLKPRWVKDYVANGGAIKELEIEQ